MLIRVISDVHGNTEALSAVLEDGAGIGADTTVCLGDVVGYGAEPSRCIELVRSTCDLVVCGNHDAGAAGLVPLAHFNAAGAAAIRWTSELLTPAEREWLSSLPMQAELDPGFHLCHSDPVDPGGWRYMMQPAQVIEACRARPGMTCLVGHTHMACSWTDKGGFTETPTGSLESWDMLNCGSAGQPRDRNPEAAYLLLDTDAGSWTHVRVAYDIDGAAGKIRDAGLPEVLWQRLYRGY
jgi:diadenosine tetraphosphatase ApaH/serine/threonine PP2A family protein phosphatase